MSASHSGQWTIVETVNRPDPALVAELAQYDTTQIADCGGPVAVVGPQLRRLAGSGGVCGPAVTVWTRPGDILYVLKATDLMTPGDVLVVDSGGRPDAAVIGDIAGGALLAQGCAGLVVDGAVRDVDGLDEIGLSTFAVGAYPAIGSNQGPGAINVTVVCAGATVRPGDVIRADGSGIVVVPREHLAEVVHRAGAVARKETGWREEVAAGASLSSIAGLNALIAELAPAREDVSD